MVYTLLYYDFYIYNGIFKTFNLILIIYILSQSSIFMVRGI